MRSCFFSIAMLTITNVTNRGVYVVATFYLTFKSYILESMSVVGLKIDEYYIVWRYIYMLYVSP